MDITNLPLLSTDEKKIMRASDESSIFEHKFTKRNSSSVDSDPNANGDRRFFGTNVIFSTINIPIRIPLSTFSEEIGDVCAPLFYYLVLPDKAYNDIYFAHLLHIPYRQLTKTRKVFTGLYLAPGPRLWTDNTATGVITECAINGKMCDISRVWRSERPCL
jgi:hypothetical protein